MKLKRDAFDKDSIETKTSLGILESDSERSQKSTGRVLETQDTRAKRQKNTVQYLHSL